MPKKGKKSGKKKGKSSSGKHDSDKVEGLEADAGTMMDITDADGKLKPGSAADGKGGKKKKKGLRKKKVSTADKALEKLEKAADKLKANKMFFIPFVNRMDRWLAANSQLAVELFKKCDQEDEGYINYDDFKSGMFDLGVICNRTELHLLAKLMDRENSGDIDYYDIPKGLQYVRELEEMDKEAEEAENILIKTDQNMEHCKKCKMGINGPSMIKNPRYLLLELVFVTFHANADHPWHLEELVHTHIPVCGLLQLIAELTGIQSTKLSLFSDKSRNREAMLPPDMTLKELGYEGASLNEPEETTLYYDYKVEFTDCPVLLCDHYFGEEVKLGQRYRPPPEKTAKIKK
ncbi:uncharacterized protein [Argopecten irradians]|uniref:uncharacterized protein isoform X2 n=1 Tax=Argopecten irradians TaxID=31199 RepID=UPI003712C8E1